MAFSKVDKLIETENAFLGVCSLENMELLEKCVDEVSGKLVKNPQIMIFGKEAFQRRSIGFFSNESEGYRYSGQMAESQLLTPNLSELLKYINEIFNANFNGILVNRYENGENYIGAHSDDEKYLDPVGVVCVSWGESRKFRIRDKVTRKIVLDIPVESGKILIMAGDFQKLFLHEIPVEKKKKDPRISFTFRKHTK